MKNKKESRLSITWKRLKKNKMSMISLYVICLIILLTIFANVVTPYGFDTQDLSSTFQYPSLHHPMGTDNFGRDIFTRVLYGGRISLLIALFGALIGLVTGGLIGATAGYLGNIYDNVLMRFMDILMAIPSTLLAIAVSAALGSGIVNTMIAVGIGSIPLFARVTRSSILSVREQEYIESAKAIGASGPRILFKHMIPNAFASSLVIFTLRLADNVLIVSSLSFLGLGVQPPTPEWGSMISAGRQYMRDFWPIVVCPGLAIMVTLIAFNLLGDGLRDALDPRLKQ